MQANSLRTRSLLLFIPVILVGTGAVIGIYTSEDGSTRGDQLEPLACQEFARSGDLPAGKRDILRLGCEASKARRASRPQVTAPVVTLANVEPSGEATSPPSPSPYVDLSGVRSCQAGDLTSGYAGTNGAM